MTDLAGNSEFCFPLDPILPSALPRETLRVSGKLNSLFPLGSVIKCDVTSFSPTRNWGEGEKSATAFASFTRSAKCIISNRLSSSPSSLLSFSRLAQVCSHKRHLATEYFSNGGNDVEFWVISRRNSLGNLAL